MKKYIENSKNYFVDSIGVVYGPKGVLKGEVSNAGYVRARLYYKDGSSKFQSVHRLVAEAFIPNPDNKPQVNHIDGNKQNNSVQNLEWSTVKENAQHASDNGLLKYRGENHHNTELEDSDVEEICRLMESGYRNCDIVEMFGVTKGLVSWIRNGGAWKHISSKYQINKGRQKRISVESIIWICNKLQDGLSVKEIFEISTNHNITKAVIYDIKSRKSYKEISSDFTF